MLPKVRKSRPIDLKLPSALTRPRDTSASEIVLALLFLYASPGLRLEAGKSSRVWSYLSRIAGLFVIIACLVFSRGVSPARAYQERQTQEGDLQITIDMEYTLVKTGDKVEYNTVVTNNGTEASLPLIVAMNVINLDAKGEVVDPEDWSPQRTQYIESLTSGQSASQHWIINTILDGNYMVYMVLIPTPSGTEATSRPVATSGIHLTVTPFTRLNPGGVLPYAIGGPVILLLAIVVLYRLRRRVVDSGDSS